MKLGSCRSNEQGNSRRLGLAELSTTTNSERFQAIPQGVARPMFCSCDNWVQQPLKQT
ncbi:MULTISPECIES: hypothetical protein [unclassified Bradyrhizobium]|uniref:hypothetical protein n=1 Tax=unclassified Bradyrhizobium TaxID=2631580 RepID=UPI0020B393CA|nr:MULTISPECIES: hypothetical protein [unclassified Bradyrhizobium]MCP3397120.1 hypothetical protein [Bradyrhizobium sp. CCGB20]MCP3405633.1 hypothetical protein [Bradyrhizobium sp. CCGB01]